MKIKKNGKVIVLNESDLKRIINTSENLDEGIKKFFRNKIGSKIQGIKGLISGEGYNVTKYAYQLSGAINEINEELIETKKEFQRILKEIYTSKMQSVDWEVLDTNLEEGIKAYEYVLDVNNRIMEKLNTVAKETESQSERDND